MGNSLGRKRKMATVMKADGGTMKFKTPMQVREVVKDYPGHVLIESETAKNYGIRAKPLEPQQELKPRKVYFLLELPNIPPPPEERTPRRARSVIHLSAKDRLENLMLARRSSSDISIMKTGNLGLDEHDQREGTMRVRMRLPKAQVTKLVEESRDATEAAEKIVDLCLVGNNGNATAPKESDEMLQQQNQWRPGLGSIKETVKTKQKRVGFITVQETEIID